MPSHDRQNCGEGLTLRVENNNRMVKTGETSSFYGNVWTKTNSESCSDCSVVWQSDLATCSPQICGNYPENQGDYIVNSGKAQIEVCSDSTVKVTLTGIINRETGKTVESKRFEVYYLTFSNQKWSGDLLGSVTTDEKGNFNGKIGKKVDLPITKSFVLNADGHSQFITR